LKLALLALVILYFLAMAYLYFFQTSIVFNSKAIKEQEPISLPNTKEITLQVKDAVLQGVYKKANSDSLIIYFGGNADDATRFLLHVKNLEDFDVVSFNYRGYINSTGEPSQDALYLDALKIYDTFNKGKKVVVIGRSLGTGVATYLASKREVGGVALITPYDSILSIAQKKYPMFPISLLLKHQFNSSQNILSIKAPVALIEVANDTVVTKYHFDKLKQNVQNLLLHVNLENTTHGDVLLHKDFGKNIEEILKKF
jgi:esterase/lipase